MKNQRNAKLNNKGFTLIELLIAVAVVAVIVAPILTAITTSMKVNKKSDDLLNETSVAQTFMEGMEEMSLEEIARQFSQTTNPNGTMDFLPAGMVGELNHDQYNQNSFVLQNGVYEFQKSANNIYTFAANNVQFDNKAYDVKVTLDATDYYKEPADANDKFNDKMYVDIADYDSDYDGLYSESANVNKELCSELAVRCVTANHHKSADDIAQEAERTITLNVESTVDPLSPEPLIEIGVHYKLKIPKAYVGEADNGAEEKDTDSNIAFRKFEAIFKNKEDTTKKPRNIYILYNPDYYSTSAKIREHIVINNPENIPITVYLIKQSSVEESKLSALESNYRMDIKVIEGVRGAEYATKLRTNLGYNLYDLITANNYREERQQVKLSYECAGATTTEDIYNASEKITGESNETVRIFHKKIEVYPSGAAANHFSGEPLTTLSSE